MTNPPEIPAAHEGAKAVGNAQGTDAAEQQSTTEVVPEGLVTKVLDDTQTAALEGLPDDSKTSQAIAEQRSTTEVVPEGLLTKGLDDAQAAALEGLPDDSKTSQAIDDAKEALDHKKQQRRHKECLFWCALGLCVIMLGYFTAALYHFENLLAVTKETQFVVFPVMLSGIIPTAILIFTLKNVFGANNADTFDKKDLEIFKELASIFRVLSK